MAGTSLLALIDDIASVLDDVAVLTKVAAKKTSGVLGDDLALNAQQVAGPLNPGRSFVKETAMSRKWIVPVLALALCLLGSQATMAKEQYVYSVKFVCGYNPTNVGMTLGPLSVPSGEPPVKFGNYATEINIFNPQLGGFDQTFGCRITATSRMARSMPSARSKWSRPWGRTIRAGTTCT